MNPKYPVPKIKEPEKDLNQYKLMLHDNAQTTFRFIDKKGRKGTLILHLFKKPEYIYDS